MRARQTSGCPGPAPCSSCTKRISPSFATSGSPVGDGRWIATTPHDPLAGAGQRVDEALASSIAAIVTHRWPSVRRAFEAAGGPQRRLFRDYVRVRRWLDHAGSDAAALVAPRALRATNAWVEHDIGDATEVKLATDGFTLVVQQGDERTAFERSGDVHALDPIAPPMRSRMALIVSLLAITHAEWEAAHDDFVARGAPAWHIFRHMRRVADWLTGGRS